MTSVGILTVSTKCSQGLAVDKSGPALEALLSGPVWTVSERAVVSDSRQEIASRVLEWSTRCGLIVVSGGTGLSADDVTVEALDMVFTKRLPALATAMVVGSLKITKFAALSQVCAGLCGKCVVLGVPGSTKGATENVQQVLDVLPHAVATAGANGTRHLHADEGASVENVKAGKVKAEKVKCGCSRMDEQDTAHDVQGLSNDLEAGVARRARKSPYPMIPVDMALQQVLENIGKPRVERVPLGQIANGQVVAEDVVAREHVPAYRASIMDGYAMSSADGAGVFAVRRAMTAGASTDVWELQRGEIVRVATGAPVPRGADAVVMIEDTELVESVDGEERKVRVLDTNIVEGQNIRPVGHDLRAGVVVARAGTRVTAVGGEIGTLAISGNSDFAVYAMPRIAVMSTGDEVVDTLGKTVTELPLGAIRDSNRPALLAALRALGCDVVDFGVVRDDPDALSQTLDSALDTCDGVISTGGVSMGERDWLKPVIEQRLNGRIVFGRVAMKPSKPTTFAVVPYAQSQRFVFALPGNPVSAVVSLHMFVAPAVRKLAGHLVGVGGSEVQVLRPSVQAVLLDRVELDRVRPEYVRGVLAWDHKKGAWTVELTGRMQQSSRMASMQAANALVSLPIGTDHKPQVDIGETVTVIVIGPPQI
ncbi:hypothetical protein LPJ77_003095 [Coemansia sp. RSA 2523]|nr:hypothetical protein LPJ54_002863 [Coemansia sp. RSA 1824]KAJ1807296.1 hypothetical protein LPJ77_003095 [Coemansia sp. RSA 2523]KAJ2203603.1 hypothetical protein IW145_003966 [Coemansia sp. RSA 521]KAJ2258573.1 hypothetical protein GGH98_000012 [Coemansia sp. RSA 454]KAJ2270037.1 hypothetical protein J3F81_004054 [Coemansia sp. RSA 371]KAJ2292489.1 hypothetical protein IW141_001865 [Coemansia sp. RSA 355]KAJ2428765.1 hypothetical protein GGF47_001164 [Coemansia sp. RSA 2524]KAJ2583579.1 